MLDTCLIMHFDGSEMDDYGHPQPAYSVCTETRCGFDPTASREVMADTAVVLTDARLRLPLDTEVDPKDRVKVTHRYGRELSSQPAYEIVGEPMAGPSGLVLDLKLATE